MENQINIENLKSADYDSYLKVLQAYRDNCFQEEIYQTGFNQNTGYVYIALENGIQIASCFGQSVDYIVTDFETGEESFFDTYDKAMIISGRGI